MNDKDTPQTPERIAFESQLKFRIPIYQRPYAWTTIQVELLLEDLWQAFGKDKNTHYHIGIMSIADSGNGSGTLDIVDGQQHMTTLMLIGKAAENHAGEGVALGVEKTDGANAVGDLDGDVAAVAGVGV